MLLNMHALYDTHLFPSPAKCCLQLSCMFSSSGNVPSGSTCMRPCLLIVFLAYVNVHLITELSQWPCGNRNPQPEPPLSSSSGPPPFRFIVLMNPSIFPCLSVHHSLIFFIFHSFMERKVKRDRKVCWRRAGMTPCVVLQVRVSPGLFLNWSTYALSPHHFVVWSEIWDDQSVSLHNAQPITHNAP